MRRINAFMRYGTEQSPSSERQQANAQFGNIRDNIKGKITFTVSLRIYFSLQSSVDGSLVKKWPSRKSVALLKRAQVVVVPPFFFKVK